MKLLKQILVMPAVTVAFLGAGVLGGAFAWQGNSYQPTSTSYINAHEVDFSSNTSVNYSKSFSSENYVAIMQNGGGNWGNNSPSLSYVADNKLSSNVNYSFNQDINYQNKSLVAFNNTY